jgi:hypothetical protein
MWRPLRQTPAFITLLRGPKCYTALPLRRSRICANPQFLGLTAAQ